MSSDFMGAGLRKSPILCQPRVLGCNDSVKSVLQLGDTNGDSLINEDEFRDSALLKQQGGASSGLSSNIHRITNRRH